MKVLKQKRVNYPCPIGSEIAIQYDNDKPLEYITEEAFIVKKFIIAKLSKGELGIKKDAIAGMFIYEKSKS
jgi:hypothetical protein